MQDPASDPAFPACLTTEMPRSNSEETCPKLLESHGLGTQSGQRVRSITTRIETASDGRTHRLSADVDESVPSQQGLKPNRRGRHAGFVATSTSPFHHNKD